jgi:catechol 2,3-dioxygenase-like lactoylglutathione lyase family enzyme
MGLDALIPMLSVADLERTMAFYCGKLGFRVINTFGGPKPVWCMLEREKVRLMFNQPPGIVIFPEPKDRQIFYFYPDDIVSLHSAWMGAELAVTDLRVTAYGMKEFELRDPDGYWLWFGESTNEQPTVHD